MAFRTRRTRLPARGPGSARVLALAAALAAAAPVAACTPAPASSGASTAVSGSGSSASAAGDITAAQAGQVFDRFVATANAQAPRPGARLLALATGVERAVLSAALGSHSVVVSGSPSSGAGAYSNSLSVQPGLGRYAYGAPAYYLPQADGYPRFFVASVTRAPLGGRPAGGGTHSVGTGSVGTGSVGTGSVGGTRVPAGGPVLMLFDQARANAPWLLASVSQLPPGVTPPKLATDGTGHVPAVPLSDASLVAQPGDVGPLQAAVVDDGPASAASQVVAAGQLTTGLYQAARDHAGGLTAPRGDVYQWELDGASFPEFALRTAAGGALVFYAMSLDTTVAVPDVINKGNPVRSGPPIAVPADVRALLPAGQATPLVRLQTQQTLSFAAVDPAPGSAKIQVIAGGGGLTGAAAA